MSYFSSACLRIIGDGVSPELCSAVLKIMPDKAWKKGDAYHLKHDGRVARHNTGLWVYSSKLDIPPFNPDLHAKEIIRIFSGKAAAFEELKKQGDVRISVIIDWGISHGTYYLDRQLLQNILDLGVDDVGCCFVGIDEDESE